MHVYIQLTDTAKKKGRKKILPPLALFMSLKLLIGMRFLIVVSFLEFYCSNNFLYLHILSLRYQHDTILKVKLLDFNTLIKLPFKNCKVSFSLFLSLHLQFHLCFLYKPLTWEIFIFLTVKGTGIRIAASNQSHSRQRGGSLAAGMNLFDRFARVVKVRFQEFVTCIHVKFVLYAYHEATSWYLLYNIYNMI